MPVFMGRHKATDQGTESFSLLFQAIWWKTSFALLWQIAACLTHPSSQRGKPRRSEASPIQQRTLLLTDRLPSCVQGSMLLPLPRRILFWRPLSWHRSLAGDYRVTAALSVSLDLYCQRRAHSPLPRLLASAASSSVLVSVRQNERDAYAISRRRTATLMLK